MGLSRRLGVWTARIGIYAFEVRIMGDKIKIDQYYDWWFDNALEFLGHLLTEIDVDVEWDNGIAFAPLDDDMIALLVDNIERLIKYKLTYLRIKKDGTHEKGNRTYLPTTHKGKYVNFLGKEFEEKKTLCSDILSHNELIGKKICDICGSSFDDKYDVSQVSQTIYPVVTGSLKSQCGVRKMESEYHSCPKCALLGSIEWLDDNPFTCDNENLTNYILFPKIEDLERLHNLKDEIRDAVKQGRNSNIMEQVSGKRGVYEKYAKDEFSLLLSLFEHLKIIGNHDEWMCLKIKGTGPTYQTKYSYLEEIKIPNINSLERIFCGLQKPYSNFVDKSFTKSLKSQNIDEPMSRENKYLMSKGIIMDDFKSFSKAFQVRQNCILAGIQKDLLNQLINQWRCKNGAV
jgi:hypothetical protein